MALDDHELKKKTQKGLNPSEGIETRTGPPLRECIIYNYKININSFNKIIEQSSTEAASLMLSLVLEDNAIKKYSDKSRELIAPDEKGVYDFTINRREYKRVSEKSAIMFLVLWALSRSEANLESTLGELAETVPTKRMSLLMSKSRDFIFEWPASTMLLIEDTQAEPKRIDLNHWMRNLKNLGYKVDEQGLYRRFGYKNTSCNFIAWCNVTGISPLLINLLSFEEKKLSMLSTIVKLTIPPGYLYSSLTEMHMLKGFRKKEFDLEKAVIEYAHSGNNLTEKAQSELVDYLYELPLYATYVPLLTYIEEANWRTSGSASGVKMDLVVDGHNKKLRVMKNGLIDLSTPEVLYKMALSTKIQHNKVIRKEEISKDRLAVSADLNFYFVSHWLMHMFSRSMYEIENIVGDESLSEQYDRVQQTMKTLRGRYGVSFDYSKFDHQVPTKFVTSLVRLMALKASLEGEEAMMVENLALSFDDSWLIYNLNGEDKKVRQTGGLPSGNALTTMIGNLFNYILCIQCGAKDFKVKGDDSGLIFTSLDEASVFFGKMREKGVNFDIRKSFVRYESYELLRNMISPNMVSAPVSRAIEAISNTKPWSDNSESYFNQSKYQAAAKALSLATFRAYRLVSNVESLFPIWAGVPEAYGGVGVLAKPGGFIRVYKMVKEPVIARPRRVRLGWRESLIENQLHEKDVNKFAISLMADRQWLSLVGRSFETREYVHVEGVFPLIELVRGRINYTPITIPELDLEYLMTVTGLSRYKCLKKVDSKAFSSLYSMRRWGYKASEKYFTSGWEVPSILTFPPMLNKRILKELNATVIPQNTENYFRSVYSSCDALVPEIARSVLTDAVYWYN